MSAALVSVIVPVYNCETFIGSTIATILGQSHRAIELIVVDDHSSDNSVNVINAFKDERLRVVSLPENVGPAAARNVGVGLAKGDYIAFCDSDDTWEPKKIEIQLAAMSQNDWMFTYTRYKVMDEAGVSFADSGSLPSQATYKQLLSHCFIRTSSIVYSVAGVGGKVYFPLIKKRQDFGLFLNLLKRVPSAHLIDQPLCSYRIRRNSVSSNKFRNIRYQWAIYRSQDLSRVHAGKYLAIWFMRAANVYFRRRLMKLVR